MKRNFFIFTINHRDKSMSRNYKFHNSEGLYFISFAVVGWLDVFTRNEYKDLFIDSLVYCQKNKGLEIHAWCILSNHVHLIFRSIKGQNPELLVGDLKRFTSQSIVKSIQENPDRSDMTKISRVR
jgi:REP element-mobilizing transposase RayT